MEFQGNFDQAQKWKSESLISNSKKCKEVPCEYSFLSVPLHKGSWLNHAVAYFFLLTQEYFFYCIWFYHLSSYLFTLFSYFKICFQQPQFIQWLGLGGEYCTLTDLKFLQCAIASQLLSYKTDHYTSVTCMDLGKECCCMIFTLHTDLYLTIQHQWIVLILDNYTNSDFSGFSPRLKFINLVNASLKYTLFDDITNL